MLTPFQIGTFGVSGAILLFAWLKGGHPERFGVVATLTWTAVGIAMATEYLPARMVRFTVEGIPVFEISVDLALLAVFVWMALRGSRWWPFAASAVMTLSVFVYLATALVPGFDRRAEISAHLGLLLALDLALLGAVGERWLAGEVAASRLATWKRRHRTS